MRNTLGKITITEDGAPTDSGEEYQINSEFAEDALRVAEELDLDEIEAARLLLDATAEDDTKLWDRPLWACGVMRFHQERRFLLDCMRLLVEVAADEDIEENLRDNLGAIVEERVFRVPLPGSPTVGRGDRIVVKCMIAMQAIRTTLQTLGERTQARSMLAQGGLAARLSEAQEVYEFSRVSLVEQHELLAIILCAAIDKRHSEVAEFREFVAWLKKADKYDHMLGERSFPSMM